MKTKTGTRRITSILVGLTFSVVAVTGVLMFLHVKSGTIVNLHQWLGIAFAAAAVIHLCVNWRAFSGYLGHRSFWVCLVAVALVCAVVLSLPGGRGQGRGRGLGQGYGQGLNR